MKTGMIFRKIVVLLALLSVLAVPAAAFAADEVTYYKPITEISLGVKELTLKVGEQYTLPLTHKPEETPNVFLDWYTDETTVRVDPEHLTVTALAPGKTRLLVESTLGFAYDYCDITVTGSAPKDVSGKMNGSELVLLSQEDRGKITAESVRHYLEFIENSSFSASDFTAVTERKFNVTAEVKPGTTAAESRRAVTLGMEKALELPDLDAVSLYGTLSQILAFAKDNDSLIRIFEFEPFFIDDPLPDETDDLAAKGMNLKDNVEALTSVSKAHKIGLKGDGAVIAVIDSGLDKDHEQFKGRVIAEKCAALEYRDYYPVCTEGSSAPSLSKDPEKHNHGSHVAGIAAGRDGIAPNAKIISIGQHVERCTDNECVATISFSIYEVAQYLADLQDEYKKAGKPLIVAANMSFGNNVGHSGTCDSSEANYKAAFDLMMKKGIIPVVSSGNSSYDGYLPRPACLSNAFTVGALYDQALPTIRPSSNHSQQVAILAPGSNIWSALYTNNGSSGRYGYKSGTSMAAPMVTGAFAVLKQAYPNLEATDLESVIKEISTKTVNFRPAGDSPAKTFSYKKPVLDFSLIQRTYEVVIKDPNGNEVTGRSIHINTASYQLKAEANPVTTEQKFSWSSSDTSIAKVSSAGKVTFSRPGTVTITAKVQDGSGKSGWVKISYKQANTCGTNVKYAISGNTITFSRADSSRAAVWGTDCGEIFQYDPAITVVKISDKIRVSNGKNLFFDFRYVQKMYLANLDVSNVTSMSNMFSGCSSLTTLDVKGWDTSKVTDMSYMFYDCSSLTGVDVSAWSTYNVSSMAAMFSYCSSLNGLNVSSWNTVSVTDMRWMFFGCKALTKLDVGAWNTANVKSMLSMFYNCNSLTSLNVGSWNTTNVTDMRSMFYYCYYLKSLDVRYWDTSHVTSMSSMFNGCSQLSSLDVSLWDTSYVTDMSWMFAECISLTGLPVEAWSTYQVTNMAAMFYRCTGLRTLPVSSWLTSNVKNMSGMFYYCEKLPSLDVSKWDTSNVTTMRSMFADCSSLKTLPVAAWNTSKVTDMSYMFNYCLSLTNPDVSRWNTSKTIYMDYLFGYCRSMKTVNVSAWNTSNVISMSSMFEGCTILESVNVSKWNTAKVTDMSYMFWNCPVLKSLDLTSWNTTKIQSSTGMFVGCSALKKLTFGTNSLKTDIFTSLRYHNSTWYYIAKSSIAKKPLAINASKKNAELFKKYDYNTMAGTWSVNPKPVDLVIPDSNIRGKNKEIRVVIPWGGLLSKVEVKLYDEETNKQVSPLPEYKERMDAAGKNLIVTFVGDPLENGKVYRLEIRVYNGSWSKTVKKYAMPIANVYGATVVAGNRSMIINNQHRKPADGTRYMIYDAATDKEIAYKVGTKSNTTWTYSRLTNGKLYYVVAVPYRDYKGQRLWGPNENRIYFIPMAIPTDGLVSFTNNTTAKVSITKDNYKDKKLNADGIRVLYRIVGSSLKNGCEGTGNSCTITGLTRNTAYEFYVMKYKTVDGKKYYSMGTLIPYMTSDSGLKAPQNNPVITMSNSGNTTFTIKRSSGAVGISVLYREGEGQFKQACEAKGNTCSKTLDVKKNYTFFIMQYKMQNDKKVYSPGIVARDFSSGKSVGMERLYTKFEPADESITMADIAGALGLYYTEDQLLMVEAKAAMGEGISVDEYLSLAETPVTKGVEELPAPEEVIPAEPLEFYRLEETPRTGGTVPGFDNK